MQGSPGIDFPEDRSPVDVLPASRGTAVMCFVERIGDDELVTTVGQDRAGHPVRLSPGERMDLVWKDAGELRALPVELLAVETAPQPLWRVRPVGPAARGQRRSAVRAPLSFRVVLSYGRVTAEGTTVDLSEGGVRGCFDLPAGAPPRAGDVPLPAATTGDAGSAQEAGDSDDGRRAVDGTSGTPQVGAVVSVTVWFDDRRFVTTQAEVTRDHGRSDGKSELSVRFIGLTEKMQDMVRREVFVGLRELRARGVI